MMFMLRRAGCGTVRRSTAPRQGARLMADRRARQWSSRWPTTARRPGVLADRLGLDADVRAGVEQSYARWDGKGVPADLEGDALSLAARISHVAEACEVFHRLGGVDDAVEMVRARSGTHFDPAIADAVCTDPEALFDGIDVDAVDEFLDARTGRPADRSPTTSSTAPRGDRRLLRPALPVLRRPRRGTADLVDAAAAALHARRRPKRRSSGGPRSSTTSAASACPAPCGTSPGRSAPTDRERMRLHVYYVERIFKRPEPLRRIGLLAATHHERMDGSGYHRGVGGTMLIDAGATARRGRRVPRDDPAPAAPRRRCTPEDAAARAARRGRRRTARR